MKNKVSGLPDGFVGVKMSWDEVNETFQIVKACVLERDKINEKGEKILYQKGPKQGQPVPDRQVAFQLHTASGKQLIVRTNSQAHLPLQRGPRQGARLRQQVRRQDLRRRASGGRYAFRTLRAEGNEGRPRDEVERRRSRGGRVSTAAGRERAGTPPSPVNGGIIPIVDFRTFCLAFRSYSPAVLLK